MAGSPLYKDMAASFAKTMRETGDAGLATTAAFYQWFGSDERQTRYYVSVCSEYLNRQDASHNLPRYELLEAGFYEKLCKLPDGSAYECSDPTPPPN